MLAVLAASGRRPVARDRLLLLFWPERDTQRARHSLDQALYALKRDAGGAALVLGREELALNPEAITSDVGEFTAALERGDSAAAVALHTGPFLDGVYISGALDFERWADGERARLTREVERAIESLAGDASARGDHRAAAEWWQRLAAMDMRKTRVVIALMSELAATGRPRSSHRRALRRQHTAGFTTPAQTSALA